jgi:hypothetical protein
MRKLWLFLLLVVAGCFRSVWITGYESLTDQTFARTEGRSIKFEEVDYAQLQKTRDLPGFTTIGVSSFRDQAVGIPPGSKDSSLRVQASQCGATYVRWASRSVTIVSGGVAYGGAAVSGTNEIFDYYAVFYHQE